MKKNHIAKVLNVTNARINADVTAKANQTAKRLAIVELASNDPYAGKPIAKGLLAQADGARPNALAAEVMAPRMNMTKNEYRDWLKELQYAFADVSFSKGCAEGKLTPKDYPEELCNMPEWHMHNEREAYTFLDRVTEVYGATQLGCEKRKLFNEVLAASSYTKMTDTDEHTLLKAVRKLAKDSLNGGMKSYPAKEVYALAYDLLDKEVPAGAYGKELPFETACAVDREVGEAIKELKKADKAQRSKWYVTKSTDFIAQLEQSMVDAVLCVSNKSAAQLEEERLARKAAKKQREKAYREAASRAKERADAPRKVEEQETIIADETVDKLLELQAEYKALLATKTEQTEA